MIILKNSQRFKSKLIVCRIACILTTAILIYFCTILISSALLPYFSKIVVALIYVFIIASILICSIYYIINLNKIPDIEKVLYELDNKIEKIFNEFGLYITENYIICLGSELNVFKLFVAPIKNIKAIDTYDDDRYYHKYCHDKKNKSKLFLQFVT